MKRNLIGFLLNIILDNKPWTTNNIPKSVGPLLGHQENPQVFVKLVILYLRVEKPGENGPNIYIFQVLDQNMEVIGLYKEYIFLNIGLLAAFSPCITT